MVLSMLEFTVQFLVQMNVRRDEKWSSIKRNEVGNVKLREGAVELIEGHGIETWDGKGTRVMPLSLLEFTVQCLELQCSIWYYSAVSGIKERRKTDGRGVKGST